MHFKNGLSAQLEALNVLITSARLSHFFLPSSAFIFEVTELHAPELDA